jgi:hypothetical protein
MRSYRPGQLVKERHGERWGEVVAVLDEGKRVEVHIKNGAKLEHNPVMREYEIEPLKGKV